MLPHGDVPPTVRLVPPKVNPLAHSKESLRRAMAEHFSGSEVKQQYVDAMGVELGEIHNRLWNECSWVHMKWGEYVTIFGTSEERVDLMNRAAPAFTRLMQDALWHPRWTPKTGH